MKHDIRMLPISEITIGDRHRKDLGDLNTLAASIEEGMLQPIGVSPGMELIWGLRRLAATRDVLGRKEILSRIVSVDSIVQGQFDENTLRKDFTPSERVAIIETLRAYSHGGDRKSDQERICDVDRLTTKDAAARVGFCRDDFYRAKKVVSRGIPELVDAMDTGKLSIYSASELADADQELQRLVLSKRIDEDRWGARGVQKKLRGAKRERERDDAERRNVLPAGDDNIRIYHCPFQRLEEVAGIAPGTVDLVLTDIPYDGQFLAQVSDLGAFAARVLVPGGLLVTYSGTLYLNQVIHSLDEHLTWAWSAASAWMGDGTIIHPRQVTSKWKPILIYFKGEWRKRGRWQDLLVVNQKEKGFHEWQQPLAEVENLVKYFSQPGDLVVDTCGGGFTTALACRNLQRRCIACDIDEAAVIRGQDRLNLKDPGRFDPTNSPSSARPSQSAHSAGSSSNGRSTIELN
jgi:DNA methylase